MTTIIISDYKYLANRTQIIENNTLIFLILVQKTRVTFNVVFLFNVINLQLFQTCFFLLCTELYYILDSLRQLEKTSVASIGKFQFNRFFFFFIK